MGDGKLDEISHVDIPKDIFNQTHISDTSTKAIIIGDRTYKTIARHEYDGVDIQGLGLAFH